MIAIYLAIVLANARRPLWFDELFTFYISTSTTLNHFVACIQNVDLNPPLGYALVWASIRLFGDSPIAVRLPSILSFLVAGLAVFSVGRKRMGGLFGISAMVLVWSTGFVYYAAEARPYGILLAFLTLAIACWDRAESPNSATSRWLFSACIAGMLLCHCFAVFFIVPFFVAEALRAWDQKRIDPLRWVALVAPLSVMALYLPLLHRGGGMLFPPAFQPSLHQTAALYYYLVRVPCGWIGLLMLLAVAVAPAPWRVLQRFKRQEVALVCGILVMPLVLILFLARGHVAYWPRYCICAAAGASLAITGFIFLKTGPNVLAGALTMTLAMGGFCVANRGSLRSYFRLDAPPSRIYREVHPDLPFVTASGLTFLEMDHREGTSFVQRLFYLTDYPSAVRYAHATIFEGLSELRKYFPIRGNVTPYRRFISTHDHFLVFATPDYPEDWLLSKLKDDGARIRKLCDVHTDSLSNVLFEVRIPLYR